MKKIQKLFALILVLLFISSCTSPAAPTPTPFEVDGLWSATFTVTESTKEGPKVGQVTSTDVVLETRGSKFSIRNTKGVEIYSGTRSGNTISVTGKEGLATLSLNGSFSTQTSFSGTGIAIHPTKGTIKYTVVMTKK